MNITFSTEYDREVKTIRKSQAGINRDSIENGKIIAAQERILAITKPYIKNIKWEPSAKKRNNKQMGSDSI